MNPQIVSLQFALFYSEPILKPYPLFGDLGSAMSNIFDSLPQMMDLPPMLPAEVPLITYRSEDGRYVCTISRARIDFHVQRASDSADNSELVDDFNLKTASFVQHVLKKTGVSRFGLICRYFYPSTDPVGLIAKKYLAIPVDDLSELSVRFNKVRHYENRTINDLVDISVANASKDGTDHRGVFVQRDINNQPLDGALLTAKELQEISRAFSPYVSAEGIEGLLT